MEEGSLLQQALQAKKDGSYGLENTLLVDVFLVSSNTGNGDDFTPQARRRRNILTLAGLCVDLNRQLQEQNYMWWCGGDGPVFGFSCNSNN